MNYDALYRLAIYAPRSVDPTETTVLTPVAGAPHALPLRVATRGFGLAARIGQTITRYFIRNPVDGNLLSFTEELDNAVWSKANITVTPNAIVAPNGERTADKVEAAASTTTNFLQQVTSVPQAQLTYSIHVKKGSSATESNRFGLHNVTTATDLVFITLNYDTGVWSYTTGGSGVTVVALPDGWYRIIMTVVSGITAGNTVNVYAGFVGSVETAGEYLYAWGAQLEGGGASAYRKVTTAARWPTTAFTAEFWGRLDTGLSQAQPNWAVSYANTANTNAILFGLEVVASTWRVSCHVNGVAANDDTAVADDNKWHHFLATWVSSGGVVKLYRDGALIHTATGIASGASLVAAGSLVFGQDQDAIGGGFDATQAWKGELDEVRLYNRAFTDAEALEHFAGVYRDETGLVGSWGFDLEDALGRDCGGPGNDVTPVGIAPGTVNGVPSVTTDTILRYQPYLVHPEQGRRGRADVRNKTGDTGTITFQVKDPELAGGDPKARFLPAFLGNLKGQLRAGGLLARSWESLDGGATWRGFFTGRLRGLSQVTAMRYGLTVREPTEELQALAFVGRPHPDVTYAAFPSILPVAGVGVPMIERAIVSSSVANPSVITMAKAHNYVTGDRVTIGGHSGSTPSINGDHTITVTGATTFTIPVNVTVGGTGGHASKIVVTTTQVYGTLKVAPPLTGKVVNVGQAKVIGIEVDSASRARGDNLITKNLLGAVGPHRYRLPGLSSVFVVPNFTGPARVRVRITSTGAVGYFKVGVVSEQATAQGHYRCTALILHEIDTTEPGYMAVPANNTLVEFWVETDAPASEGYPLIIGDVHLVTLWRHLLEGKFGYRWAPPEPLPAGVVYGDARVAVPYHAAKFATLEADLTIPTVRFPVTKRQPRGRFIQEQLLRAGNLAYYFDGDGVLNPVNLKTPTDVATAPLITDADLTTNEPTTWEYSRDRAITRVDAAYYTDIPVKLDDLIATTEAYPEVKGGMLDELRHPVIIVDLGNSDLGDEPFDLDIEGFRAVEGESLNGQLRAEYLHRQLVALAIDCARPFGTGAPTVTLSVKRGGPADALPGEIRRVQVSWLPDPATWKLGGTRVVRVVERQERKAAIELTCLDLGLPTTAATPTLGVPATESGNTTGGLTVAVTLNAASDPVEVSYAVTPTSEGTAPVATDPRWTVVATGLVRTTSTLTIRTPSAGLRVWVRGRSFPDSRNSYQVPSAYVAAGSPGRVDLATLAAPTSPASANITSESFRVTWVVGSADLPIEILIATPTTDPRVVVARLAAGSTLYDFPGGTGLKIIPSTTYRVGIRHYTVSGTTSAEVTIDVTTTATGPLIHPPFDPPGVFR